MPDASTMPVDCLSVGLLVADHLLRRSSHLPAAGELVVADRLQLHIGGCASNAAMDLAKVGVRVGVVGCVGEDIFGRLRDPTRCGSRASISPASSGSPMPTLPAR